MKLAVELRQSLVLGMRDGWGGRNELGKALGWLRKRLRKKGSGEVTKRLPIFAHRIRRDA